MVLVRSHASSWSAVDPTLAINLDRMDHHQDLNTQPKPKNLVNSGGNPMVCEVGLELEACGQNEFCQASGPRSRGGLCQCNQDFHRDSKQICIPDDKTPDPAGEIFFKLKFDILN